LPNGVALGVHNGHRENFIVAHHVQRISNRQLEGKSHNLLQQIRCEPWTTREKKRQTTLGFANSCCTVPLTNSGAAAAAAAGGGVGVAIFKRQAAETKNPFDKNHATRFSQSDRTCGSLSRRDLSIQMFTSSPAPFPQSVGGIVDQKDC
jgi:hypothetical protein